MAERNQPIKDLRDLAGHFNLTAPVASVPGSESDNFYSQSLLTRLRICDTTRGRNGDKEDRRQKTVGTIGDVLKEDKEKREALGIKVIVKGDLDGDGKVIAEAYATLMSAKVYVRFPSNFKGNPRMLSCSDSLLAEYEDIPLARAEQLSDEVSQETVSSHNDRLRMNIKSLDTLISKQKNQSEARKYGLHYAPVEKQVTTRRVTNEMERLNRLKNVAIWDFLRISLQIEEAYPHLQPLFTFLGRDTDSHINISMWSTFDKNVLERLINSEVPEVLEDGGRAFSTNINLLELRKHYLKFNQDPDNCRPHEVAGHHTLELILQKSISERQRRGEAGVTSRRGPREIVPDLTSFLELPVNEQLVKVLNDKKNAGKDNFARDQVEFECNAALRNALAMSPDERQESGIDVVIVAPLDKNGSLLVDDSESPEYSIYVVFDSNGRKQFIKTHRAKRNDNAQADDWEVIDALVQQEPNLVGETVEDTYSRRLYQMRQIGVDLSKLARKRKSTPDTDTAALLALTQEIDVLGEQRTALALSAFELADIIHSKDATMDLVSATSRTQQEITLIDIAFNEISQNTLGWLLNLKKARSFRQSGSLNVFFQQEKLRKMVDEFDRNETETNGAAVALSERLQSFGIQI